MTITINNRTDISNKYIRFIKWRLYRLKRKFSLLHYANVFIGSEGHRKKVYTINIRLGIPGDDIILKQKASDIKTLLKSFHRDAHRYLSKANRLSY